MVDYHHLILPNMNTEEQQRVELMYRQPGVQHHQNITDVLDEIIIALRILTDRVIELENKD